MSVARFERNEREARGHLRSLLLLLSTALLLPAALQAGGQKVDPRQWMVELEGEPAVLAWARTREAGSKAALAASSLRLVELEQAQARVEASLTAPGIGARVQFRTVRAFNGIAIFADPSRVDAIRALPGVKAVTPLVAHERANSTSVPHLGVPATVWQALGNAGEDVKVAVIDSGVDYQHAMFGGSGAQADYAANDRTKAPDSYFPTARVVGGHDFAGDDYDGSNSATPDPDPMDCGGHGSHVAGSIGGSGVNADGTPYAGPWDGNVPFGSLRIGPGVAPKAKLYALRVLGCSGSTRLTTQAIDWAVDPNGDGDFSAHLDVINMSLGSPYGSANDSTAVASENAARAGVVVVCSAGNEGDTHFVTGSPGAASSAISVAASADSGLTASMLLVLSPSSVAGKLSAGPASFGGAPPRDGTVGPLVAAVPPDACAALTNGAELTGRIALIDRGNCSFDAKIKRAQDAGAIGVVIANNVEGVINMGVADPAVANAVRIPSVSISLSDANRVKAALREGVTVGLYSSGDTLGSFSSRGPRRDVAAAGPKPDLAAPGVSITSAATGVSVTSSGAVEIRPGSLAATASGTSMAAPHMTGVMALLRRHRPGWTVAELKAAAMNTSGFDVNLTPPAGSPPLHGPTRVGAGRVDAARALATEVLAFDDERPELVSLSAFLEGTSPVTVTRRVRVVNKGIAPVTLTPGWTGSASLPGVRVEVPVAPVVVPAGGSTTFDVNVSLTDPTAVTNAPDPALALRQGSYAQLYNRFWMPEAGGLVTLSGAPAGTLRVPVSIVVRGQSSVRSAARALNAPTAAGSFSIPLAGTGLKTGPLLPVDVLSTVSAFELHAQSPRTTSEGSLRSAADLAFVGAASSAAAGVPLADATIWFGLATHAEWFSPVEVSFEIEVDRDADGSADAMVKTMSTGDVPNPANPNQTGNPTDVYVSFTSLAPSFETGTYRYLNVDPATRGTNLLVSNVVVVPAPAGAGGLGLEAGSGGFKYRVRSIHGWYGTIEETGWLSFNPERPVYSVLAADRSPFHDDLGGTALPAVFTPSSAQPATALGVLLLHHHAPLPARAEVLTGSNAAPSVSILEPAPGAAFDVGASVRLRAAGTDADPGDTLTYTWSLGDGRTAEGADVTTSYATAGIRTVTVTVADKAGATATAQVTIDVRSGSGTTGVSALLPVVLSVRGVGGAAFTTEVTLVSRATTAARAALSYVASAGSGSGTVEVDLAAGETKVLPDVIAFLRSRGLPIPNDGSNQIGTLRVTLPGTTDPSALFVGGRTSTPGEGGSFGLFYSDAAAADSKAIVAGLQQNAAMRSNLAVLNAGADPVTLRVRLEGPNGEDLGVLADQVLPPWGWKQFDRPLEGKATSGRAIVTRLSGSAPFSAYGVLNDAGTSDGSFVPPLLPGGTGPGDRLVPVVLDVKGRGVNRYVTELTVANLGASPLTLSAVYTATAAFGGGSGSVPLTLSAGEQRVIPDAMAFLRTGGLAIPADGSNVAGSLLLRAPAGTSPDTLAAGARVSTRSSAGNGSFGVFYPGLTIGSAANGTAFIHGLQQNAAMRSNVAVVNYGDSGAVTLRITYLGASGQTLASPDEVTLAAGEWRQINEPLSSRGAAAGSAKVERVSGTSRFLTYGVLNDAATSDGSYLPMTR